MVGACRDVVASAFQPPARSLPMPTDPRHPSGWVVALRCLEDRPEMPVAERAKVLEPPFPIDQLQEPNSSSGVLEDGR
jgi:hypothetical protein